MKYLSYLFGALSAAAAGGYFAVYLYRWEWQRALISGVLLLVVEIFLVCVVVLSRISRLERRLDEHSAAQHDVLRRLESARRDPAARPFPWLDGTGSGNRTYVFVPVLMAAGAVLSFTAWVVQKVAAATARPGAERRLAGRLTVLTVPPDIRDAGLERRPALPPVRRARGGVLAAVAALGVLGLGILVGSLADATQTRAAERPDSAATIVVFRVELRPDGGSAARDQAARELWESCRRSTRALPASATLSRLEPDVWSGVLRPALGAHDMMRLRGCLDDASVNRVRAHVLGAGQAG
ncbi:hypothetical protein AB0M28_37605 [Streptomyces sp. NPDC051940]|uniref:hypothetical protein n=1 Tax=Streptomyces sp. NPDC051940 TaxID=3155675 RepID=UPI0034388766